MASEPFFEERSDAVKMSETPYPTNGSGKNPAKDTGINVLTCVLTLAPIASQARHFPRKRGQLTIEEEREYDFKMYYLIVVLKRKAYET